MATITVTIPDTAAALLTGTHGDLSIWLTARTVSAAKELRDNLNKHKLGKLMLNEAFLDELAPLIRKYAPEA